MLNPRWIFRVIAAAVVIVILAVPTGIFWSFARPVFHKDIINKYASVYKFDPLLIMAIMKVESGFVKTAKSPRGAIGLMQLMPVTAMEMAKKVGRDITLEDVNKPEVNIHLGIHYVHLLRQEFKTDTVALLAAYNAGPTNARAWMKDGPLMVENIPFKETKYFVTRVIDTYLWLKRFQKVKNSIAA